MAKKKSPSQKPEGRPVHRLHETGTVQTAVRLERSTYEWLKASPGSMTYWIKRGIELVQLVDQADPATKQLALQIIEIAHDVELEVGPKWQDNASAYRVFRRAVLTLLHNYRPDGYDPNLFPVEIKPPFQERKNSSYPTDDADELGIVIASDVVSAPDRLVRDTLLRQARRKNLRDIARFQQQRERREDDNGKA
jgi:hypothetical protein